MKLTNKLKKIKAPISKNNLTPKRKKINFVIIFIETNYLKFKHLKET